MKSVQLENMIRAIVKQAVAEEIRSQLPVLVSEMYIKRLVSEAAPAQVQRRPQKKQVKKTLSLEQAFEQEMSRARDAEIPHPMPNSDEGIYQEPSSIKRKNESKRSKLLSSDNAFASMFEGVVPTDQRQGTPGQAGTELPMIPPTEIAPDGTVIATDVSRYGEIFKRMNTSPNKGSVKQTPETQMRVLELQRQKLDNMKVG